MPVTYKAAGVNIYRADEFVRRIAPFARKTYGPQVIGHLGASAGLFRLGPKEWREPVLVASADGVGSKILVAEALERYDTLGSDLVAMNVNDLLTTGARPLFFLDYLAVGRLDLKRSTVLVKSISEACAEAGCSLLGGETAEMPLVYPKDRFDLAGFAVGIAEEGKFLWRTRVQPGDQLLGIASSGLHSNGYSLALKVARWPVSRNKLNRRDSDLGEPLGSALLRPTRIYVRPILDLIRKTEVHAIAHITGGGLYRNVGRILPRRLSAVVQTARWPKPEIFKWISGHGPVSEKEMFRTFNMGIGLVLALPSSSIAAARKHMDRTGWGHWVIGRVVSASAGPWVRFE